MHRDADFDLTRGLPANRAALSQDLELNRLFRAMALDDQFLHDIAERAVLSGLADPQAIVYRQRILADCLEQPSTVRSIYALTVEALQAERKIWRPFVDAPDLRLHRSVEALWVLTGFLKRLRRIADEQAGKFRSEGWVRLFTMLTSELDDAYLEAVNVQLRALRFRRGVLLSAELGRGNKGVRYVLRRLPEQPSWLRRVFARDRSGYSFELADRDESGFRALGELRGRGINIVANALAQSADHILSFFTMLRAEIGFYVGCLNLHERLTGKGEPICLPSAIAPGHVELSARGLYDVCLALSLEARVVGNDVNAKGKSLVMITGANQGGKSTFLRSVGLAQLMMQSGMFVAAESFTANVCGPLFTHFKREEDAAMESGKLDEELCRMSEIAEQIRPNCLLLCNESFAATNEREGSEIARQIIRALTEAGIKVLYVTHLFDLAQSCYRQAHGTTLFLRAERQSDGRRTFRLVEGEPLPTSYGEDSYRRIFGKVRERPPVKAGDPTS